MRVNKFSRPEIETDERMISIRGLKPVETDLVGGSTPRRLMLCKVVLFCAAILLPAICQGKEPKTEHVLVIGCDGFGTVAFTPSNTPVLHRLMREGAYTLRARGVLPTVSSPNWASMIMGAGPEQHGITSNDWQTNKFDITPVAVGSGGIFPTIFGLLREQRPQSVIACFHDWDGFGRLFERKAADMIEDSDGPTNAVQHAIAYIQQKKPTFTFIHLDHV